MTTPPNDPVTPETEAGGRPAGPARASSGSARILNLALVAAILVAVAGVAFAVGRTTAPAAAGAARLFAGNGSGAAPNASFLPPGNGMPGTGDQPGGAAGNGGAGRGFLGGLDGGLVVEGTVESVSADSVTIGTTAGTTITVGLDASTTYHQQAPASASDVTAGDTVKLQITGGFRPDRNATTGGTTSLGTASDVTVVP